MFSSALRTTRTSGRRSWCGRAAADAVTADHHGNVGIAARFAAAKNA